MTVIYGPGGIGKTFFLRRLANKLSREAQADPTVGIPVFAELPLLLHVDALENCLSRAGIRLPLPDIRALLAAGVITPLLDALDELVRGQARQGSRDFLRRLRATIEPQGRAVLSSRDYYLNLDPLVRDELGSESTAELQIGHFDQNGRRRYIQMRTGLPPETAGQWAGRLEEQTAEMLEGASEAEIEGLIGHPLFLDALSAIIAEVPQADATKFQVKSPDVFGEILTRVLEREHGKFLPGWEKKFATVLSGDWTDPFEPSSQEKVFRHLVLLAAQGGARAAIEKEVGSSAYRRLRHGVFVSTPNLPPSGDVSPRGILQAVIREQWGDPEPSPSVAEEEIEELQRSAVEEAASFFRQHTLADTRADLPEDLVFATRHRAYFDYLLAEALLGQLQRAMRAGSVEARDELVDWCLEHHVFEREQGEESPPFSGCLDFALWHREGLANAEKLLTQLFQPDSKSDEVLASYALSFGLALLLRSGARFGSVSVAERNFAPAPNWVLELVESIVPSVANLTVEKCSFPTLRMVGLSLRHVHVRECVIESLEIGGDASWRDVHFSEGTVCRAVSFHGNTYLEGCTLDIGDEERTDVRVEEHGSIVRLKGCRLGGGLWDSLDEQASLGMYRVELIECERLEPEVVEGRSAGRLVVDKLMALARKGVGGSYIVYSFQLRGQTRCTDNNWPRVRDVLRNTGVVKESGDFLVLTSEAQGKMYWSRRAEGRRPFEDVSDYWNPVIEKLDGVLR